jgi:hypothetical protein
MNLTPTSGMSFVQAATLLAAHLAEHALPKPASLTVTTRWRHSEITAQLCPNTVPGIAGDLLAWVGTLSAVTVTAWRPSEGDRVHLSITSTLTSPVGAIELTVFGGTEHDPARFADLTPGQRRSVSLAELRAWAQDAPTSTIIATSPILPPAGASR